MTPPTKFGQAITQFNQRLFYECHDTLEDLWMEAAVSDRNFYQGILQIAVACHHLGNQNLRGASTLLGEGIRRLSAYEPDYGNIDVTDLVFTSHQLWQKLHPDHWPGQGEIEWPQIRIIKIKNLGTIDVDPAL